MRKNTITYEITMENGEAVLYNVVDTRYGGPARNYVARGVPGFIRSLKATLEASLA